MEARKIDLKVGGFYIVGNYPESGDQWVETGPLNNTAEARDQERCLGPVDPYGLGFWCIAQLQADGSFVLKEMWEPERILSVRADLSQGVVYGGSCEG